MQNKNTSLLHLAAHGGHKEVVEFLLAEGSNVNSKSRHGKTPLHSAAMKGHLGVVEILVRNGADLEVILSTFASRKTPLDCAVKAGHKKIVEFLKKRMDSKETRDK